MKELVVFIDSGDTLVDESTEIRDADGTVLEAELFEGAAETLLQLYESGYVIALVADGTKASFENIFNGKRLNHCFHTRAISAEVGCEKPSEKMFRYAMEALGLTDSDKNRVVMIGNNLKRDIAGANRAGIISILAGYSPRYDMRPKTEDEIPDYVVATPAQLIGLLETLDIQVRNRRILTQAVSDDAVFKS